MVLFDHEEQAGLLQTNFEQLITTIEQSITIIWPPEDASVNHAQISQVGTKYGTARNSKKFLLKRERYNLDTTYNEKSKETKKTNLKGLDLYGIDNRKSASWSLFSPIRDGMCGFCKAQEHRIRNSSSFLPDERNVDLTDHFILTSTWRWRHEAHFKSPHCSYHTMKGEMILAIE